MATIHKFKQEKLWRDKLPAMMEANYGSIIHIKPLNDTEYDQELRIKLQEETAEVVEAKSHKNLIEELADVCEVIDALCALHGISKEELEKVQSDKRELRGGFYERAFVTVAEHPAGSYGDLYCRAQPDKYPEIL